MTDREFFDAPSPLGERDTRREAIEDYADNLESELTTLKLHVEDGDLARARKSFEELKCWLDALDDNLCEREDDGSRKG